MARLVSKKGKRNKKPERIKISAKAGLGVRAKLIMIFIVVMLIPLIVLTVTTWNQITSLSYHLRDISVTDATIALNDSARDNIERMTTGTSAAIAEFLYQRDQDMLLLASLIPSNSSYRIFSENRNSNLMKASEWVLSDDKMSWVEVNPFVYEGTLDVSSNVENNDVLLGSSFRYRPPEVFAHYHELFPLYDEITYIDLDGQEVFKYVSPNTTKVNYPMNQETVDVSDRLNTYIKAETYWEELQLLEPGEIYVSDVIGAYVGTNYIGMYTPGVLMSNVPQTHPNYEKLIEIANLPTDEFIEMASKQAYAGRENPLGRRFEGIVRWATPVADATGEVIGYVTMALNHDHIMEFVDYITPMAERYTIMPDAYEGNYAFIWDYQCRNIAHPRHHSIVGYNPMTGEPQVPWLEGSPMMVRDTVNGGFALDREGKPILVYDAAGVAIPARDTPFYYWYMSGGEEWLRNNPSWNELAEDSDGVSWGAFYEGFKDNRVILPQFGERPLRDSAGNFITDSSGNRLLDYQSRVKTPARALTQAGFVGLDGRYLNNAPQCTGWMDLTENGGSGSFYIFWSGILKPTTAGAIPYYTGKYAPEVQGNSRGFAFVAIGAGIEDFTAPVIYMEERLLSAINLNIEESMMQLFVSSAAMFALIIIVAFLVASTVTKNIKQLIAGIYRFRTGDRHFRIHSKAVDEFGILADSFDEMADSIENSTKSPLVITDMNYRVIYMNNAALETLNKDIKDVTGMSYEMISIYPANSKYSPIEALREGRDAEVFHREEDDRYFMGTANYLYDQDNNKTGYIIATNDVTDIQVARKKAEAASEAKSIFLSNMSHEIRTPLNAIIGMTTIGETTESVEKKDYALGKIHNASKHLLGVINDILDVSKIEASKFTLSAVQFSLNELLERVVDMINFRVDQKSQTLTVKIDKNIPDELYGDDQRLVQVIMNILSNAVKFTNEKGAILLDVSLKEEKNGYSTILIVVQDNGIGISKEQQEHMFKSFEQAEASTSRRFGGTGLGLVICKSIIEMMDGKIWIESELGKGMKVSFTVRLAIDKSRQAKMSQKKVTVIDEANEIASHDYSKFTVLLVEDVEINREIVMALLEPTKLKIECAENGRIAVKTFLENPSKFDMIFMDIQMPEMDGYTATRLIRESISEKAKTIPIVAMTANAFKEDIDKCLEAGMNGHIGKPLEFNKVIDTMDKFLKK